MRRKKHTYRDIKPGRRFLAMAGYGAAKALTEYEVESRDTNPDGFWARVTWTVDPRGFGNSKVGNREYWDKRDTAHHIKTGLILFDREYDRETGILVPIPPTDEELVELREKAEAWDRFTKSETYRCM